MNKYIHCFETEAEFNNARNNNYIEPWVSYTKGVDRVDYNKTEEEKLLGTPLTFEITGDGDIMWKANGSQTRTIEYRKNDGEWTEITSTTAGTPISVVSGDTIQFRGNNLTYATGTSAYNSFSGTTAEFNVRGNIMSLISSSDFAALNALTSTYTFNYLMYNCTGLTDASKLVLPATTLADYCYNCMFRGCTSLTIAPELPATTLTKNCYSYMFYSCANLASAPELPATTLANSCYNGMFNGCANLNHIKAMFTTTPGAAYTQLWVLDVSQTGTFVKNSAATWNVTSVNGVPLGWTVETTTE